MGFFARWFILSLLISILLVLFSIETGCLFAQTKVQFDTFFPIVANGALYPSNWSGERRLTPNIQDLLLFFPKVKKAGFTHLIANVAISPESINSFNHPDTFLMAIQTFTQNFSNDPLHFFIYDSRAQYKYMPLIDRNLQRMFSSPLIDAMFIDEPTPSNIEETAKWIFATERRLSSSCNPLFYVNLFGCNTNVVSNYLSYVKSWINIGTPFVLSYDNYCLWDSVRASRNGIDLQSDMITEYYWNLELFRQLSLIYQTPFWNWILVHEHWSEYSKRFYHRASPADLRFQIYSSLCYGAKGILYYNFWNSWEQSQNGWHEEEGLLNYNFGETPLYSVAAEINQQVLKIAPVLLNLRSLGIYHASIERISSTFPIHSSVRKEYVLNFLEPSYSKHDSEYFCYGIKLLEWNDTNHLCLEDLNTKFVLNAENRNTLVGLFKHSKDGTLYIMIVNKNRKKDEVISLTLDNKKIIQQGRFTRPIITDVLSKKMLATIYINLSTTSVSVTLRSGEGRLYHISDAISHRTSID
jgi:hypothetical protein